MRRLGALRRGGLGRCGGWQVALGCGTVGFDADIFTGSPSLRKLLDTYDPKLSAEEQAFLDKVRAAPQLTRRGSRRGAQGVG